MVWIVTTLTDGLNVASGVGVDRRELNALAPATVLDTGLGEVIENGLLKRRGCGIGCCGGFADRLQLAVLDGAVECQ